MTAMKTKREHGERVEQVRLMLTWILEARASGEPASVTPGVAALLCWNVGIWPLPPDDETRLQALATFAERALPALNGERPDPSLVADQDDWWHNFSRWCEGVQRQDGDGVRAGAVLLGFWRRADARQWRVH